MTWACKRDLQAFLEQPQQKSCRVVVAPDFFLDRIVNLPWNPQEFSALMSDVASRKGGSLDGIAQSDISGGNAINVASALAHLGASVTPIVCTSNYGLEQIRYHTQDAPFDLSHIQIREKASITTALEFAGAEGKTNVMIRDVGSLTDFGPADLTKSDYELIEAADYVCLFNWVGTLHHGTELAEAVFGCAKRGKCRTYYDTADPTPNKDHIAELVGRVLKVGQVDILSLNENEAVAYACVLDADLAEKRQRQSVAELALEAARILAAQVSARVDLHTTAFSASIRGSSEVVVPTFKITPQRATGAGDAWCAGNLIGDFAGLFDECRLTLANAVAACYLQSPDGSHPTRSQLQAFLSAQS
jgi:sugar/nucleoside kinase (ribokinase family)